MFLCIYPTVGILKLVHGHACTWQQGLGLVCQQECSSGYLVERDPVAAELSDTCVFLGSMGCSNIWHQITNHFTYWVLIKPLLSP